MSEQEIFLDALNLESSEERLAFIKERCGGDDALRKRLEALLQAHAETGNFLGSPAIGSVSDVRSQITEDAGTIIGPYKLLQRIGEGGFGVVYMAEQSEPVRRKVALKIIKPGMDTREVIARFESERQALALMDHPNIARVLDAGATDSGRPYFVMELVKGVPITDFCDKNHLSVEDRMNLFIPVCLAVQHAHHKGIIHRDIKPSNVMVTLHDGKPVPKVIDFGVAKATSQQLTQKTLFTAYGQMIGTPLYMSPEQAEMSGLDIDTRSDIYSLGVLLYELLTGTTPIEQKRLREAGFAEMQRLIRDIEAPRPSTRLSSLHNDASVLISTNRGTDAKRLSDTLRGDVDWIVMKALEKDRQRRYDTPNALADDIQRFLKHEAIIARPPSTAYRVQKFIQRNKGLAFAAASITCALLLGAVVSMGFAIYANSQLDRAVAAESRLQGSLTDAQRERKKAIEERDRAVKAEAAQSELTQQAEQSRKEADAARMAELQQRQEAERQRDDAQRLKDEAVTLNRKLTASNEEQRRSLYASDMNLIRIEAQRGNLKRMREILMAQLPIHGEEDLRGFEWNYWYRYLNQATTLMRFDNFSYGYGPTNSVATMIPGGRMVAVTQKNQTQIMELESGKVLSTIPEKLVTMIDRTPFSKTGRSVYGVSSVLRFKPVPNVKGNWKKECSVYEPAGTKITIKYPANSFSYVCRLSISPDGKRVAAVGLDVTHKPESPACRMIVWDVDSAEVLLNKVLQREINQLAFSPDGTLISAWLTFGSKNTTEEVREVAVVLDIATGNETAVMSWNDDILSTDWLPDQKRILLQTVGYSGSNKSELLSWNLETSKVDRLSQETMPSYVKTAVSPDGRMLAVTGHATSSVRLIDTDDGHVIRTLQNEAAAIDSVSFTADGSQLRACSTSGQVLNWDLGSEVDLFAVQKNPLKKVAIFGSAINRDQTLLAVTLADGTVLVRQRNGEETVLKAGTTYDDLRSSFLKFSDDGRYLAHRSNRDEEDKNRGPYSYLIELYDLSSSQRLWHAVHEAPAPSISRRGLGRQDTRFDVERQFMEFSADGEHLLLLSPSYTAVVMETVSGKPITPLPNEFDSKTYITGFTRIQETGRLALCGSHTAPSGLGMRLKSSDVFLQDAVTGKTTGSSANPKLNRGDERNPLFARLYPSADGVHVASVQAPRNTVEVWSLLQDKVVVSAQGNNIEFSPNGRFAVILSEVAVPLIAGPIPSNGMKKIERLTVWDLSSGQLVSEISLIGNPADFVRFSPDNRRLLTLHGKAVQIEGGFVAQGTLWDIESGRELLAIPIADSNLYKWSLDFDSTGHKLTSVLLGRSGGTGGGGNSAVFDATPLPENADAELIAAIMLADLLNQSPLPADIIAAIDARPGLKPLVRKMALEQITQQGLNADKIAEQIRKVVVNRYGSNEDFQKALRWAEALRQLEPETLRTRVLLGAAYVRCGQLEKAVQTLNERADDRKRTTTMKEWTYQSERNAMLLVAKIDSGEPPQVYGPLIGFWLNHNFRRPKATDQPDSPVFAGEEGMELVPLSTKLSYMPHVLYTQYRSSRAYLLGFVITLLLPYN